MKISLVFGLLLCLIFACGGTKKLSVAEEAILKKGEVVFKNYCTPCHGKDGKLKLNDSPDLTKYIGSLKRRIKIIKEGKGLMTPFEKILTAEEIEAVAKFTIQLRKRKK